MTCPKCGGWLIKNDEEDILPSQIYKCVNCGIRTDSVATTPLLIPLFGKEGEGGVKEGNMQKDINSIIETLDQEIEYLTAKLEALTITRETIEGLMAREVRPTSVNPVKTARADEDKPCSNKTTKKAGSAYIEAVIALLKERPLTTPEIIEQTGYSSSTVWKILKEGIFEKAEGRQGKWTVHEAGVTEGV